MVLIGPCCWLSSNDKSRTANWGREGRSETKVEIDIIDTTFSLFRRLVVLGVEFGLKGVFFDVDSD
jgi:hypothetical protein